MRSSTLTFCACLVVLIGTLFPVNLSAQFTVSGTVTDPNGDGVYPVDIDVEDSQTGDPIPIFGDSTMVDGSYSFSLFSGTYDIFFIPSAGSGLAPVRVNNVVVEAPVNLDVTTPWGFEVSGTVTDYNGDPVSNVDVDVRDSNTDEILFTPNDNTDSFGNYSVIIPEGTFDFIYTPQSGGDLASQTIWDVTINEDTTIDVTLQQAVILWGWVRNDAGVGIPNVDIDVDDAITGRRIETPHDNTDQDGFYWVNVPTGFLDVMFEAQVGSGYADNVVYGTVVNGDLNLDVILEDGFEISGYVTDPGDQGVQNVDLDVDDSATKERLHTSHDNTDSNGYYSIMVPPGTYDISFETPEGIPLASHKIDSVVVDGNLTLDQALELGYSISGTITDESGSPVVNCDLDVIDTNSGEMILTPRDNSDSNGQYDITVPSGTFDIIFQPSEESGVGEDTLLNVVVNNDIIQDMSLPLLFNQAIVLIPDRVSIFPGDQLNESITIYNNDTQQRRVQVSLAAYLPSGFVLPVLRPFPRNGVNLAAGGQISGSLPIAVPSGTPPNLKVTLKGFILDYSQGDTLNVDETKVTILDPNP
ncbi:MAG: carboxypeptidase-like regulatory domain-containing protein [Candidatus Glassbacteria bacterium]